MSFTEKSIMTLELPEILKMLSAEAVTDSAKEFCRELRPSAQKDEVFRLQNETSAAYSMMVIQGSPSFYTLKNIAPNINRAGLGGMLNPAELLEIARVLQCSRLVKGYLSEDGSEQNCISSLFRALRTNKYLEEKIFGSILSEDEIADSASAELANIRRKMRAAASRAREILQKIISSPGYAKALQEPIITMRGDRYVIPVKADHRNAVPGLVHDISATGMTAFIEPMGVVKANNEVRELAAKEKTEIERILAEFSAECAEHGEDIIEDYNYIVRLDMIFARAKLAFKMDAVMAESSDKIVVLRKARHPLLESDKAVPISLELGEAYDTLVITGPNTGGKTVSLKTIGLLALMNQCGLHIPASDGSRLPVFSSILADIGDEQSIEQNLSTFSAHMTNIVSILQECDEASLLLFDELGAGTDPAEGAALAVSVIEHARKCGCLIAATTHYTEMKIYATNTAGVQNASCEFNVETLSPTYRLLVGIPGKSNAFAISRKLGLPSEIIDDAARRVGSESEVFEHTIAKLEQTRTELESEIDRAEKARKSAEEDAKKSARLRSELELRLDKADLKSRREAERILKEARETAEQTFAELDEMRRHANDETNIERLNDARTELRRRLNQKEGELRSNRQSTISDTDDRAVLSRSIRVGDTVLIKSVGTYAEVISISQEGTLALRAGIMNITAKKDDVMLVEKQKEKFPSKKAPSSRGENLRASIRPEIDLRGMESIEAVMTAERYIDSAVLSRIGTVTIIHGKGTGVLRSAIHQMLKTNRQVKSFRLGNYGEGESGVTVVELR